MATDVLPIARTRYDELIARQKRLSEYLKEIEVTRKPILDEYHANARELDILEQYIALKDISSEENFY